MGTELLLSVLSCVKQSYYAVAVAGCVYINGSNLRKAALTLQLPRLSADVKLHRS